MKLPRRSRAGTIPLPLTIGVHYPDEVRSFRKVPMTDARGGSANAKILVGEASVKLIPGMSVS